MYDDYMVFSEHMDILNEKDKMKHQAQGKVRSYFVNHLTQITFKDRASVSGLKETREGKDIFVLYIKVLNT